MKIRRTRKISLTILASVIMASGCDDSTTTQMNVTREHYRSKDECLKDWNSEQDCEEMVQPDRRTRYWYGPRYFYSHGMPYIYTGPSQQPRALDKNAGFASLREGQHSALSVGSSTHVAHVSGRVSRGGFGSHGHSHSAGS